jgi:hypothetical protein
MAMDTRYACICLQEFTEWRVCTEITVFRHCAAVLCKAALSTPVIVMLSVYGSYQLHLELQ